uniref:Uncharacterized protein n=1 Tax=Glossina pallidipes TaxID=7398 RepID=A0A1B0A7B0_GLOPL
MLHLLQMSIAKLDCNYRVIRVSELEKFSLSYEMNDDVKFPPDNGPLVELLFKIVHDEDKQRSPRALWSYQYLHELPQRHKWKKLTLNIKPGEIDIIKWGNTLTMK